MPLDPIRAARAPTVIVGPHKILTQGKLFQDAIAERPENLQVRGQRRTIGNRGDKTSFPRAAN